MRSRHEYNGLVWIDLESPTRDEVQDLIDEFGIEPLVAQELLLPATKPRAEFYPAHAYLVLHFPALRHSHRSREQEIDFIVGDRYLITTRYETIDPLHKFTKVFEVNSLLEKGLIGDHAGFLLVAMLRRMYTSVEHELEYIKHDLTVIEEHIFSGHEVEMVETISRAARDLLNMRQVIEPHREVLRELEAEGPRLFGDEFASYLRSISNEYYRVHNHVMRQTESLHELRETNNSLLSTRENETMRVLTIMALLTFPLALLVAILDSNTIGNPLHNQPYDFWIIVGTVFAGALIMITVFKHKKWL